MLILDQQYYYDVRTTQHRDIGLRSCNHIYRPLVAMRTNSSYMRYIAQIFYRFISKKVKKCIYKNVRPFLKGCDNETVRKGFLKKKEKYKHFF